MTPPLAGKKTYVTAVMAILGFWAAWAVGEAELADTIQMTVVAVLGITLRHGVTTEAAKNASKIVLLCAMLLPAMGCTALTSPTATNVTALLFMALTAMGWIKAEGTIDANRELKRGEFEATKLNIEARERESAARMSSLAGGKSRGPSAGGNGSLAGAVLLALLLLPAMGCTALTSPTATELDAWYELRADLNAANRLYIAYGQTADLSDRDEAQRVVEWGTKLQQARALLARARPLADQPGGGFDALFEQIEAILIELAQPRSEFNDDGTASPDPRAAWRLRDRQHDQPAPGPGPGRRADHARAA